MDGKTKKITKKNIAVRTSDNFGTDLDRSDLYIGCNSIETQKGFYERTESVPASC